jgi:tRNA(Ile2) C34 agmatinyltransferase TiaS
MEEKELCVECDSRIPSGRGDSLFCCRKCEKAAKKREDEELAEESQHDAEF